MDWTITFPMAYVSTWMIYSSMSWTELLATVKYDDRNLFFRLITASVCYIDIFGSFHIFMISHFVAWTRVVKRSLDLRTSNFKFQFVFVFQPFDIPIQASLIRRRPFCLKVECCYFSGALCDDFFVLCRPSIQATPAVCLLTSPLPSSPCRHCASGACCKLLMQAIKVTNVGGPDTEQTSIDGNRTWHDVLADCNVDRLLPACGVRAVTFISPHNADIKRKLLKLLHKYVNKRSKFEFGKNEFNIPSLNFHSRHFRRMANFFCNFD